MRVKILFGTHRGQIGLVVNRYGNLLAVQLPLRLITIHETQVKRL